MDPSWTGDPALVRRAHKLADRRHVSARDAVAKALLRDLAAVRTLRVVKFGPTDADIVSVMA